MIKVMATATVNYVCRICGEQEEAVIEYAKSHNLSTLEAVREMYSDYDLNLYGDSDESDFYTESIDSVEVDDGEEELE